MSDTPKTDAATIQVPVAELPSGEGITHPMVPAFVSRDLERELSVANNWVTHHQNHVDDLIKENAALRAELAPLRETVGVAATASTCADDLSNWSKLVERADNSTRLERENAALREKVAKLDDPARLHAHCVRYLTDAQVAHLFGERMTAIQNDRDRLEAENTALKAKVDVIVKNYDDYKAENAALKIERNRYKVALQDIASSSTGWAKERAQMQLRNEAQP